MGKVAVRDLSTGDLEIVNETLSDETPAPLTQADFDAEMEAIDDKLRAVVRWVAQKHSLTMAEAIAELKPIYRAIRGS